jgi:hypothetical protein
MGNAATSAKATGIHNKAPNSITGVSNRATPAVAKADRVFMVDRAPEQRSS